MSRTGVVNAAEANTGDDRHEFTRGRYPGGVAFGEWIKRVLNWHTDTGLAQNCAIRILERVGCKRHRGQRGIEEGPGKFEVGKGHQVFVANVTRERTVISLTDRKSTRLNSSHVS